LSTAAWSLRPQASATRASPAALAGSKRRRHSNNVAARQTNMPLFHKY